MKWTRYRARLAALPWPQALRGHGGWLLLGVLAILVLLAVLRRPLADLVWPDSRIQLLLDEGERALAAGRLDAADGSGARQKFEAAQALDNDRTEARHGLARVGAAALADAEGHLDAGRYEQARAQLVLARALQVPRDRIDHVAHRLREQDVSRIDAADALQRADAALAAGDPDAALPLYARVLAVDPHAVAALEGREDALSMQLERVRAALAVGRLEDADRWLQAVRRQDAGHIGLPEAQAWFAQALERELQRAGEALRRGRPGVAARRYLDLLPAAPDDARLRQGAQRASLVLAAEATRQAGDFQFESAEQSLQLAAALAPGSAAVERAEQALEQARRVQARGPASDERLSRAQQARLRAALDGFAAAMARAAWVLPPGDSAYDHLRAAQALAPESAAVRDAAAQLQVAARGCLDAALRDNRLRQAQACLDAWQVAAPTDPALLQARGRIAQRWLAIGEERLRAGEVDVAMRTLESARALDPQAVGLDAFAEQIARARSGVR